MKRSLALVFAAVLALAGVAIAAQERRTVVLEIALPNGSAPELRIVEGETGTISLLELGRHGFVPALRDGGTAVVDVLDMNDKPHRRLDRVEATVGGDTVQSNTQPQFGIRVIRVATQ